MDAVSWLFHQICVKDYHPPSGAEYPGFDRDELSMQRFFKRFGRSLDFRGKAVLDVGCGAGAVCFEAARRGAKRVVGVDIQLIDVARRQLETHHADLAGRVEFTETGGALSELGSERFDVILSKDSFEHYANPEAFVPSVVGFLAAEGELVIGFGPLWRAPGGGHIDFMTKLPWAHLLFPERVIMAERRRFRPDEHALRFEDIVGGLNKITVRRFQTIMSSSGLECVSLQMNVSDHPAVKVMRALSHIPPLREYFTVNVYSIWRRPAGTEVS